MINDDYSREIMKRRIEELCAEEGISRMALSQTIGAHRNYIYGFYSGHTNSLDGIYIRRIAEYFGVSTDYLFGLTDEKEYKRTDQIEHGIQVVNEKIAEYNLKIDKLESVKYAADQLEKMYSKRGYLRQVADYIREFDKVNNTPVEDLNISDHTKDILKRYFLKEYGRTEVRVNDLIPLFKKGLITKINGLGNGRYVKLRNALLNVGVADYELDKELEMLKNL